MAEQSRQRTVAPSKAPRKRRRRRGRHLLPLLLVAALLLLLLDSNTRIVTETVPIKSATLPASFSGFRIVQLSDLHGAVFGADNSALLKAVSHEKPDIIAVTGDLIDDASQVDAAAQLLGELQAVAPVYYITGNHEWAAGSGAVKALLDSLTAVGVTPLRNSYIRLTRGSSAIILAGIDDPNGPADMKTPEALLTDIHSKEGHPYIVLLGHRNSNLDRFSTLGIDLLLCGHAHGGMIRLPFIGGLIGQQRELFPKYTAGLFQRGGLTMVVSRGLGNHTGVPRFLNNPDIPVCILQRIT